MALTLESLRAVRAKSRYEARKPGAADALRTLFNHLIEIGAPDLKIQTFVASGDQVVSDSPCKLYAIYYRKPSASVTDAWLKVCDAAAASEEHADVSVKLVGTGGGGAENCVIFPDGVPLATGCVIASHTANDGKVASAAGDSAVGFVIVGAP